MTSIRLLTAEMHVVEAGDKEVLIPTDVLRRIATVVAPRIPAPAETQEDER